jgi:[protein-PII] uridylyltransferase
LFIFSSGLLRQRQGDQVPTKIPGLSGHNAFFSSEHLSRRMSTASLQEEIKNLQQKFRKGREQLFHGIQWTAPSHDFLQAHVSLIDGILKDIYKNSCWFADREAPQTLNSTITIVATGGYGRKELNPYSDIDIAFLPPDEEDPWVEAAVHFAFKLVMDVFLSLRDVHVGYAFRPITEASSWNVSTKTALLDLRYICGNHALADKLQRRVRALLSPLDIMLETPNGDERNQPGYLSMYSVEPNLKEGPGSLRDLHRARWIFKLLLDTGDEELESALLNRVGISERQLNEIREAADWFLKARTWLHLKTHRPSDVLINNYQDQIARDLGGCPAQEWLSQHISHAEALERYRNSAIRTLIQGPYEINGIRLENGSLHIGDVNAVPNSAAPLFHIAQRYSIPVSLQTQKELEESREQILKIVKPDDEEVSTFKKIFSENRNIASTLRALAQLGAIDRFIPKFSHMLRYVPPESSHNYTVGEHSFRMIEHLESLRFDREAGDRRFADLLTQCSHFDMLCLASLLHDAGKLVPGKDHCITGADMAKDVADGLHLTTEKKEILDILIRHHLLLVRTVRLHDLKSTNVLKLIADRVPDIETLRHLYVFTYADISAVSNANWTSMDDRDLQDLYNKMKDFYSRSDVEDDNAAAMENKIRLIRKKLVAIHSSKDDAAVLRHCDAMPAGYVLNTPLGEISLHIKLLERLETERVVIDIYNRPREDHSELTLCTFDDPKPGILAKITGVLYGCGVNIHKAQALTMDRKSPVVLDTLWIQFNGQQISESKARRIEKSLKEVLTNVKTIDQFLSDAGKVPPDSIVLEKIDLRNDLSEEHTVVNIVAQDLKGLLFTEARCLSRSGLDIHSAKVAVWSDQCENNFYVTTPKGGQIPASNLQAWKEKLAQIIKGNGE